MAVEFVVAVVTITLVCASGLSWLGKILVMIAAAVSLPFEDIGSGLIPALAGISCWVVLPALAGLFPE